MRLLVQMALVFTVSTGIVSTFLSRVHAQSSTSTYPSTEPVVGRCTPTAKPDQDWLYKKMFSRTSVGDGYVADVWKLDREETRGRSLTYFYALQRQGKLVANLQVGYGKAYGKGVVPFWAMKVGIACSTPTGHDYPIVWVAPLQVTYKVEHFRYLPLRFVQDTPSFKTPSWRIKVKNQLNAPDAGI